MNRVEGDKFLLALDGVVANIETLRSLIAQSIVEVDPITDGICHHFKVREIQTHGANAIFCDDCGYQL
jgi:hypothetical protein